MPANFFPRIDKKKRVKSLGVQTRNQLAYWWLSLDLLTTILEPALQFRWSLGFPCPSIPFLLPVHRCFFAKFVTTSLLEGRDCALFITLSPTQHGVWPIVVLDRFVEFMNEQVNE
jgi:hypothetical protein